MTTKAWSIIDQLAQDKLHEARENVSLANQALQKVAAQKLQLFEMLNDYQSRLNKSQETKHSIDEHVSYRHFIKQVQDLIEVIEQEEHQAELRLQSEEDKLIDALKEKKKTEFLIERESSLTIKRNQVLEQKRFDELGISRFNHR